MILGLMLTCEVAFWVVLLAALTCRYLLRAKRVSTVLLYGLPLIDLILLITIGAHLATGARPESSHGLGALYLGFTIMFVGPVTASVDGWFARRFDKTQATPSPKRYGVDRARYEWAQWGRAVVAAAISAALLGGMVLVARDADAGSTAPLMQWFQALGGLLVIWFLIAASYTVFPKKAPAS